MVYFGRTTEEMGEVDRYEGGKMAEQRPPWPTFDQSIRKVCELNQLHNSFNWDKTEFSGIMDDGELVFSHVILPSLLQLKKLLGDARSAGTTCMRSSPKPHC